MRSCCSTCGHRDRPGRGGQQRAGTWSETWRTFRDRIDLKQIKDFNSIIQPKALLCPHVSGPLSIPLSSRPLGCMCQYRIAPLFARHFLSLVMPRFGRAHHKPLLILDSKIAVPAPLGQLTNMFNPSSLGLLDAAGLEERLTRASEGWV